MRADLLPKDLKLCADVFSFQHLIMQNNGLISCIQVQGVLNKIYDGNTYASSDHQVYIIVFPVLLDEIKNEYADANEKYQQKTV